MIVQPSVSKRMAATRGQDNPREKQLRSELHRRGLRFRVHARLLIDKRRSADIVFPAARIVVFSDGCFWHGCPTHGTWPASNARMWRSKILENRLRDRDTDRLLKVLGWRVLRVWEHEPVKHAVARIARAVKDRSDCGR
jgi:DNA mismatch endonuclease (patch repair protein)